MSIIYRCRHCHQAIGVLDQRIVNDRMLGLDQLSEADKCKMVHRLENGDRQIDIICEDCQSTLNTYPDYHELDFFIQ